MKRSTKAVFMGYRRAATLSRYGFWMPGSPNLYKRTNRATTGVDMPSRKSDLGDATRYTRCCGSPSITRRANRDTRAPRQVEIAEVFSPFPIFTTPSLRLRSARTCGVDTFHHRFILALR
jgi:hypothetical protein